MQRGLLLTGCAVLVSACQQGFYVVEEAELGQFDECLVLQRSQHDLLEGQRDHLEEILAELGRESRLHARIDELDAQLLALESALAADCAAEATSPPLLAAGSDKLVIGAIEDVRFDNLDMVLRARIDTGANTSSLDVRDVQTFERDGDRWVRFTVDPDDGSEPRVIERPRVRGVRILQAAAEEPERRPVVELRVSLGHIQQTAEFTLADRRNLEYPVLIGRNILRDLMVVDVSMDHAAPLRPRGDVDVLDLDIVQDDDS